MGKYNGLIARDNATVQSSSDPLLDQGLASLGWTSGPIAKDKPRSTYKKAPAQNKPYLEDGVEGADDVVVIERVSPEEEERRYFANLNGGDDLFAGLASPEVDEVPKTSGAQRPKPKVGYEA